MSFVGVNALRGAAWTVFCLDLVILAQAGYAAVLKPASVERVPDLVGA